MSPRPSSKDDIIAATVRLVAQNGVKAATIRQIARAAGVTEGAIYRHYVSKEELCLEIYSQIVTEMANMKQRIAANHAPIREKIREWTRISYEFFDHHPEGFTFILLTTHNFPENKRELTVRQGRIFMEMIKSAVAAGEIKPIAPELALSHFTGVMLNVPRLINEGLLEGPASRYFDAVADAVWNILNPREDRAK